MTETDFNKPDALAAAAGDWIMPLAGTALFHWDYDSQDEQLLRLYNQGKQRQWDADERLDWDHEVDPDNPLGMPDAFISIFGSDFWERLPHAQRNLVRRHTAGWLFSQLLHAEQFALLGVGKMAAGTPTLESKMYAATQVMDEARHAEAFNRFLKTKIGVRYGLSPTLTSMFQDVLAESRWDLGVLAAHVLVENLGLATFSLYKERLQDPLARAFMSYVLRDEARHVAFGRTMLRRLYPALSAAELKEREEFVLDGCWALRDRYVDDEIWRTLGYGEECVRWANRSPVKREFRRRVFMRVVPALKEIGLFGPRVQDGLAKMGVLGFSALDGAAFADQDDDAADRQSAQEFAVRRKEVELIVQSGAAASGDAAPTR